MHKPEATCRWPGTDPVLCVLPRSRSTPPTQQPAPLCGLHFRIPRTPPWPASCRLNNERFSDASATESVPRVCKRHTNTELPTPGASRTPAPAVLIPARGSLTLPPSPRPPPPVFSSDSTPNQHQRPGLAPSPNGSAIWPPGQLSANHRGQGSALTTATPALHGLVPPRDKTRRRPSVTSALRSTQCWVCSSSLGPVGWSREPLVLLLSLL